MRRFYALGVLLLGVSLEAKAQPIISDQVLNSVIQVSTSPVTTPKGSQSFTGTGFLVAVPSQRAITPDGFISFLVTNKHMLGDWNPIDGDFDHYDWITMHMYRDTVTSDGPVERVRIPLKSSDGKLDVRRVAVHPDKTIDVAIVRYDDLVMAHQNRIMQRMTTKVLVMDWLEPFASLPGSLGHIGGQVLALGYPNGITSRLSNRPIAKVGHLAATAGEELEIETKWNNTRSKQPSSASVRGKLILVDGLIAGGNSGGPIVFPGMGFGRNPKGETIFQSGGPSKILGVVSSGWAPYGLSFAYSVDYVKSVIELFLKTP